MLPSTLTQRYETQRLRIVVGIRTKDVQDDPRSRSVVAGADDVAITDDENQFALVVILELSNGIDGMARRSPSFRVTRNLANDELVVILWCTNF